MGSAGESKRGLAFKFLEEIKQPESFSVQSGLQNSKLGKKLPVNQGPDGKPAVNLEHRYGNVCLITQKSIRSAGVITQLSQRNLDPSDLVRIGAEICGNDGIPC